MGTHIIDTVYILGNSDSSTKTLFLHPVKSLLSVRSLTSHRVFLTEGGGGI